MVSSLTAAASASLRVVSGPQGTQRIAEACSGPQWRTTGCIDAQRAASAHSGPQKLTSQRREVGRTSVPWAAEASAGHSGVYRDRPIPMVASMSSRGHQRTIAASVSRRHRDELILMVTGAFSWPLTPLRLANITVANCSFLRPATRLCGQLRAFAARCCVLATDCATQRSAARHSGRLRALAGCCRSLRCVSPWPAARL